MFRLRCFGQVAIEDADGGEVHLRSRKHVALLLYLMAHHGRAYPRERLARLFWDSERHLARHSLSQALYDIRTKLPGVELKRTSTSVGIAGNSFVYDARAFEEAVRANDLGRAVALYEGEFAPDLDDAGLMDFERWVESERGRLRRLAEIVLCRRVRECDERAEWGEMCVSALRLLDMNPLLEEAHRALMRGLWLQGDRLAALQHYEKSEDFLERELPGGPSRETVELVERIRSSRPTGRQPVRVIERPEAEMVGREEPFRTLQRTLRSVIEESHGRLVRIWGEAGVGKTRLVEEFQRIAALEAVRVLESRCHAADSDVPYGPVVDGLSALASEFSSRMSEDEAYYQLGHLFPSDFPRPETGEDAGFTEPGAGRRRLYEETADLVRRACAETPVVWVVEDVHWADSSSASLLRYLSRRLSRHPFLLIVTARSHEDVGSGLGTLLEELDPSEPGVVEVELRPLTPDEIGRLAASLRGEPLDDETVRKVHKLAGGNPFYAQEIIRTLGSRVGEGANPVLEAPGEALITDSLRALLERRMRSLDREAIQLMRAVAVAGRHATSGVVRDVLGISGAKLSEISIPLYASGLLDDSGDSLDFFHDITREFVYAQMSEMQRSGMHSSVGSALEEGDLGVDPGTLANHFHQARNSVRAYRYALEAAREAEDRYAHREAIQMAELALEHAADEERRLQAMRILAEIQVAAGDYEPAAKHLATLLSDDHIDTVTELDLRLKLMRSCAYIEEWGSLDKQLKEYNSLLVSTEIPTRLNHDLKGLYLGLKSSIKQRQTDRSRDIASRLLRHAEAPYFRGLSASSKALALSGLAAYESFCGSSSDAWQYAESLPSLYEDLSGPAEMQGRLMRGVVAFRTGRLDIAKHEWRSLLSLARKYNDPTYQAHARTNLGAVHLYQGNWNEVRRYYEVNREASKGFTGRVLAGLMVYPELNVGLSLFYQGSTAKAVEHFQTALTYGESLGEYFDLPKLYAVFGLVRVEERDWEEAERLWEKVTKSDGTLRTGEQGSLLVGWFHGIMLHRHGSLHALPQLRQLAREEHEQNTIDGLFLRFVVELIDPQTDNADIVLESLQQLGVDWFAYFARRWVRAACRRNHIAP